MIILDQIRFRISLLRIFFWFLRLLRWRRCRGWHGFRYWLGLYGLSLFLFHYWLLYGRFLHGRFLNGRLLHGRLFHWNNFFRFLNRLWWLRLECFFRRFRFNRFFLFDCFWSRNWNRNRNWLRLCNNHRLHHHRRHARLLILNTLPIAAFEKLCAPLRLTALLAPSSIANRIAQPLTRIKLITTILIDTHTATQIT